MQSNKELLGMESIILYYDRKFPKKKTAFTLAEVLITLGIIGVVAAMTLPALINNQRNRELETSLKKAYSTIGQALDMYQAENGERYTPADSLTLRPVFLKYFKVLTDCGGREVSGLPRRWKCVEMSDSSKPNYFLNIYKSFNNGQIGVPLFDDGQIISTDGMYYFIENPISPERIYITVDVNGYIKKPNRWGHDLFTFQIDSKGNLLPMGLNGTDYYYANDKYCSLSDTSIYNGIACTYKALSEKDYFKDLPK